MKRIYLDHAATTPLSREARAAMKPWLDGEFGNPSSLYEEGRRARAAIDRAREVCSEAARCLFGEFLFTGSGTESCNTALFGAALAGSRKRIIFSGAEHHCVLHTRERLEQLGMKVDIARVDSWGRIDLDHLSDLMGDDVLLLSVMAANNETGAASPLAECLEVARRWGALFHVDAVQTFPSLRVEGADMVSVSAHKLGGPKGVGGLVLRSGVKIAPYLVGGGQEREMRAGTENPALIAGFGAAVSSWSAGTRRQARDAFRFALDGIVSWTLPAGEGLEGHAHGRIPGISAESMLIRLDRAGVAASSGAACSSGSLEPSHVLLAIGWDAAAAGEGLRFTFGPETSIEEALEAARRVREAAEEIGSIRG